MSYSGTPLSKPGGGGGERDGKTGKKYLKLSWGGGGGGGGGGNISLITESFFHSFVGTAGKMFFCSDLD